MLYSVDLYPHLSASQIKDSEKFTKVYNVENTVTDLDRLISERLNKEADLLTPIMSSGWRSNDIDSLNQVSDPRLQNILTSRLQPVPTPSSPVVGLTDDQIADNVIERNLLSSDVESLSSDFVEASYQASVERDTIVQPSEPAQDE